MKGARISGQVACNYGTASKEAHFYQDSTTCLQRSPLTRSMHVGPLFTLFLFKPSARPRHRSGPTVQAATDSQPLYSLSRVRDTVETSRRIRWYKAGRFIVYFSAL